MRNDIYILKNSLRAPLFCSHLMLQAVSELSWKYVTEQFVSRHLYIHTFAIINLQSIQCFFYIKQNQRVEQVLSVLSIPLNFVSFGAFIKLM